MRINELSSNSDKWYILSATSLRGMLTRAVEKNVTLTATDDIYRAKRVTMTQLIKMKHEKLIKDYSVYVSDDGMYNILNIFFNDNSVYVHKSEVKFKL